ncbi:unnamed protein product [Cylindrotheca closterium]|uniref:Uncharacterized protein n=1 Tax=Cylindrotheca closterium TaxID=2856 RepID=A0AAD2FYP4_9STRA|nr:unnamed protein product [Cylindrotheca closterium]
MDANHSTPQEESKTTDAVELEMILSPRVAELRERRKSLSNSIPTMNRSASNLSLASLNGGIDNDDETDKLSRSLNRIRIRRPSASFKVDMAGIVNRETIEETKTNSETISITVSERSQQSQSSSTRDNLSLRNMFTKPTGKTVLAEHPTIEESKEQDLDPLSLKNMLSKPKGKTVLAKRDSNAEELSSSTPSLLDTSGETAADDMSDLSLGCENSATTKGGDPNSNPLSLKSMLSKPSGKTVLAKHQTQSTMDGTEITTISVGSTDDEAAPTIKKVQQPVKISLF